MPESNIIAIAVFNDKKIKGTVEFSEIFCSEHIKITINLS